MIDQTFQKSNQVYPKAPTVFEQSPVLSPLKNSNEQSSEQDLPEYDNNLDQLEEDRQFQIVEREKVIERFKDIDLKDIVQKYSEQQLKLSNLSITKYNSVLSNCGDRIIPILPEIQIEVKQISQYDHASKVIFSRKNQPFLSQFELNHLNGRMLKSMISDHRSPNKSDISLFNYGSSSRLPQINSEHSSQSKKLNYDFDNDEISETSRKPTQQSIYSSQDILKFQLKHNQDQLEQIIRSQKAKSKEETNKSLISINRTTNILKHMPKVKVAPSIRQDQRQVKEGKSFQKQYVSSLLQKKDDNNPIQNFLEEEKEKEIIKLKQIEEDQLKEQLAIYMNHKIYWYEIEQQRVKPDMREHAGLEYVNGKLYLYGGLSHKIHQDFFMLDPVKFKWRKLQVEEPTFGRHQHVMFSAKKLLIIFGGEYSYDSEKKQRKCLMDLKIFNTETQEMKQFKNLTDGISPRRAAAGTTIGRTLIVHGGINTNGDYLSDLWSFDLNLYKWTVIEVAADNPLFKKGVAFHKGCAVVSPDKKNVVQIYKKEPKDKNSDSQQDWLNEEGIYFFGGQDSKFEPLQEISILKFDQRPMQWIIPQIKGQPPIARYDHSMIYNELLGLLVVYGGRNDNLPGNACFLDDIAILNLTINCWVTLITNGIPRPPRSGHCASQLDKKMVIYGGYNHNGFFNSDIQVLELDSSMAKKVFEQETELQTRIQLTIQPQEQKKEKRVRIKEPVNLEEERTKFLERVELEKKEQEDILKQIDETKQKNIRTFLARPKPTYNEELTWIAIKRQQHTAAVKLAEQQKPKKRNVHALSRKNI